MILNAECAIHYAKFDELSVDSPATAAEWLSLTEHRFWNTIRSPIRRRTFLAGRLLAKQMLREVFVKLRRSSPRKVTISSCNQQSRGCRPAVEFRGEPLALSLSITHNESGVLVAGTHMTGMGIGVDLVSRRQLGSAFDRAWLTSAESALLRDDSGNTTGATLWAMKEAAYKACNSGEPFRPRRLEIQREHGRWAVRYRGRDLQDLCRVRTWTWRNEIAALALFRRSGLPADHSLSLDLPSSSRCH